jgi:DNA-binding transcriptional ArsR family regulator
VSDKITLDRETFKALAADTRVEMLKMLAVHKLTLTDISEKTGMSPSTIKEHLDKLVEVGLIEQEDKGMKWKYYRLTNKGRNIISPNETKVWILLGTSLAVLAGSALSLAGKLGEAARPLAAASAQAPAKEFAMKAAADRAVNASFEAGGAVMENAAPSVATVVNQTAEEGVRQTAASAAGVVAAANRTVQSFADSAPRLMMKGSEAAGSAAGYAMDAVNSTGGKAEEKLMAALANTVSTTVNAVSTTATTLSTTATTVSATAKTMPPAASTVASTASTTLSHAPRMVAETTTTLQQAVSAHAANVPYAEMALLFLSLVVAGACAGMLLRNRLFRRF